MSAGEESIVTQITGKVFDGNALATGKVAAMTPSPDSPYTIEGLEALAARPQVKVLIPKQHPKEAFIWVGYNGIGYHVPVGVWAYVPDVIFEILENSREMLAMAEAKVEALADAINNPQAAPSHKSLK